AGELIDERDERQLVGIGEEEAAHRRARRAQLVIGLNVVEPLRDRSPRELGGDRGVPALLGQLVAMTLGGELVLEAAPSAGDAAMEDARAPGAVAPHDAKSAPEDPRQLQTELGG